MLVTAAVLNRTLLARQHLLERVTMDPLSMTRHLIGLQAQAPLPPYLSLHARLAGFDPHAFSAALDERRIVRLLLMRGTVHAVDPADASTLRALTQPMLDKLARGGPTSRDAATVPQASLVAAGREILAGGALPAADLSSRLGERFPGVSVRALATALRESLPLVQLPPRGLWQRSGGVVYDTLENWAGPLPAPAPATEVLRRYLRAFGPATAADITAWSRVTGIAPMLAELDDELVSYRTDTGHAVLDLDGLELIDPQTPAPVRLLGQYDNVWLSHAGRDRVTTPEARRRWMGSNGGIASTVFVNGWLAGLWRRAPSGSVDVELFGTMSRAQRRELDAEVAEVEQLLAR